MGRAARIKVWVAIGTGGPVANAESNAKLILLALADISGDGDTARPSIRTVAERVGLSESQARRVIHRLIDRGFLEVTANANGGNPGCTRHYRFNLDTPSEVARGRTPSEHARHPLQGRARPLANTRETPSEVASQTVKNLKEPTTEPQSVSVFVDDGEIKKSPLTDALPPGVVTELQRAPDRLRQTIGEELRAKIATGAIRNPGAYARTLVDCAIAGTYRPAMDAGVPDEIARAVADVARERTVVARHRRNHMNDLADKYEQEFLRPAEKRLADLEERAKKC